MERIKAIVYGVGAMGTIMTRLMVEKGVDIVGAIGHVANIGKDLGEVTGLDHPLNVRLSDNADEVLRTRHADIAVVAVVTEMANMYPHFKKCVENGLNVITTADEVNYPWSTSPELSAQLDKLAKKHGVTVTGGGFQDGFITNLGSLLCGASHTIESVVSKVKFSVDDYGPVLAEYYHIGKTRDELTAWLQEHKPEPSPFRTNMESLIADIGLTVRGIQESAEPIIETVDVECKNLQMTVKKGHIAGLLQVVTLETEQGITFTGELAAKAFRPDESELLEWYIKGEPRIQIVCEEVPIRMTTCTQMVNRIPDVINAQPGFVTLEKLPKLKYRAFPLQFYLAEKRK